MTNYPIKPEIIKQIISDYDNNEQQNKQHGVKINMSYNNSKKVEAKEQNDEPAAWISATKSGKGFVIVLEEGTPKDTVFVGSKYHMGRFVNGEIKGIPLTALEN